jgi:hypothetical protein
MKYQNGENKNQARQISKDRNQSLSWSQLQPFIPKIGLFITWLPGLILLLNFWVNGVITPVHADKLSSNSSNQEKSKNITQESTTTLEKQSNDNLSNFNEKIDRQVQILEQKIDTISEQQQNFVSNGQNTLNFLLTVIGGFTTYLFAKAVWLDDKEKENFKKDITKNVTEEIDNEKLQSLVEAKFSNIIRDLKWLEYQIAFTYAEQLKYNSEQRPDKVYLCLPALYEYLRALEILHIIKTKVNSSEKVFLEDIDIIDRQVRLGIESMIENINNSANILDEMQKIRLYNKIKDVIIKRDDMEELLAKKIKLYLDY